jgi:hypothetical protein
MSTVGRHDRGVDIRADRSCLALCPAYKLMPPGTENTYASQARTITKKYTDPPSQISGAAALRQITLLF